MKNLSTKRNSALGVLCLVILEVTFVLPYILANKSEPGSSILFGYSLPKISLISILMLLEVLLLAAIVILAFRITRGYETFRRVYRFLQVESYRQLLIFLLVLATLLLSGYYLSGFLVRAELPDNHPFLAILGELKPLLLLFIIIAIETIGYFIWLYWKYPEENIVIEERGFSRLLKLFFSRFALVFLSLGLLLVFWLLLTRTSFRVIFPYWFFRNKQNDTPFRLWQLILLLAVVLPLLKIIMEQRRNQFFSLSLLAAALLLIMPVFLRQPVSRTKSNAIDENIYFYQACEAQSGENYIRNYDEISNGVHRLETKPPGYVTVFISFRNLGLLFLPDQYEGSNPCTTMILQTVMAASVVLPLLSLLFLFEISHTFLSTKDRYLPVLIALFFPNFLTMPGRIDHYLLPFIFILVWWVANLSISRQSLLLAGLTGVGIYLAIFVSFSLLPLILLIFGWLVMDYLVNRKERKVLKSLSIGLVILGAFILTWALFNQFLDYDAFQRWQHSILRHQEIMKIKPGVLNYLRNVSIILTEYPIIIGLPAFILLFLSLEKRWQKGNPTPMRKQSGFSLVVIAIFFALTLSGTNNAEVGRLWLFLNPLIALVISFWVTEFEEPARKKVLIGYVALQLSLAYLFNFAFFGPTSL